MSAERDYSQHISFKFPKENDEIIIQKNTIDKLRINLDQLENLHSKLHNALVDLKKTTKRKQ